MTEKPISIEIPVENIDLLRKAWDKFVSDLVADTDSFSFQELETAFIYGWSSAIKEFGK